MKTQRFLLREENGDGTQGGGGAGASNWTKPDGAVQKTPEEIAAETAAAAASQGGGGGGEPYTPTNELWTELQKVEGFKMPDGITKENEIQLLKDALIANKLAEIDTEGQAGAQQQQQQKDKYEGLDPEAAAYMRYKEKNPDATLSDFVKQRNQIHDLVSMPDKAFMKEHLLRTYGLFDKDKNPEGLTDQEMDDAITALESNKQLPLEARKLKAEYRKMDEQARQNESSNQQQGTDEKKEKIIQNMKSDLQKLFGETKKIKELSGVKISEADVTEINTAFEKAVLPNEKGEVAIVQMLQSDNLLWNFFALNYLGDQKFKEAFTTAKESTKDKILSKLGLKPINTGGRQADSGKKNTITPGLWSIPESNV